MTDQGKAGPATPDEGGSSDLATLAKGGRTNFFGFLLRLLARLPFLFIAGRFYGADQLGRFASALIIIEIGGQLATLGLKRGLARELGQGGREEAAVVADGLLLSLLFSSLLAGILFVFPDPMFPNGMNSRWDLLLPFALVFLSLTEVMLAALAFRYNIAATVRSRAVVEPWVLSIAAGTLLFVPALAEGGLAISYLLSVFAAAVTAFIPMLRMYGLPRDWAPQTIRLLRLARENLPLALADAIEWGTRRLDIAILGFFVSPATVGIYYVAVQVASLPQKLKTSFEPILGPVIVRKLNEKDYAAIARQVCQAGFWIIAAQTGVALGLGITGEAVMGLVGPGFVGGTGALAFLLLAEVVAATAVVSEAALIYLARMRNLAVSIATICLQAVLTLALVTAAQRLGLAEPYQAASAALALGLALGFASITKSRMLGRMLGESINNFRWPLIWAIAPAVVVGHLFTLAPEWIELAVGVPAILATYGFVIWRKGFGPEDRVLFKSAGKAVPAPADTPLPPSAEEALPSAPGER
ncbi:oligosaccharide flippase family protein [Croceicoccus marinus]|uniref:Polysaccharide biosynthesis protein n=1 Tax=Croceicoccus marinus TaxID=450378 RepID=A0A1Z1FBD5_9SPHN|nr:oligosaccharide flippase family protein [Croceicoccus marinus]ARU16062.1 polysaccharide biosynthesis protein [Croceicoccus marinus]